jgi:hypothetical protein
MSNRYSPGRPALALVPDTLPEAAPTVWFCSHCGSHEDTEDDAPPSRVCGDCGLGVLLETRADIAPRQDGAFLVLDHNLSVCAVSAAAERLLAMSETEAVNRHLTQLLVPADAEASGPANLASAVTWAANGDEASHTVTVRPATTFGIRLSARIAHCSPPSAALLVFD